MASALFPASYSPIEVALSVAAAAIGAWVLGVAHGRTIESAEAAAGMRHAGGASTGGAPPADVGAIANAPPGTLFANGMAYELGSEARRFAHG
jgi:hypothetical protein